MVSEQGSTQLVVADNEISANTDFIELKADVNQNSVRRFDEYFSLLEVLEIKQGDLETHVSKSSRPFLLTNEVSLSKPILKMKGNKKNGKGKSNKKGGEMGKVYTISNPPPALMNYIAGNKPYRFTQQVAEGNLFTSSTTIPTFSATYFVFSFLTDSGSYAAVFDQYIIDELEYWIEPLSAANAGAGGYLYSVIDYDDASNLGTVAAAADYSNTMVSASTEGHYRRFKPHIAVASYSGTFTSFTNEQSQWIDMASQNVQHYGIKTACTTTTAATIYTIRLRVHFRLRNVR